MFFGDLLFFHEVQLIVPVGELELCCVERLFLALFFRA